MERSVFEAAYQQTPPWEIDQPQPVLVRLAEEGRIQGRVLDVGCGSGENAIFLAQRGFDVVGLDFVEAAISSARAKAVARNLDVQFELADALQLSNRADRFDTVIDSGLFHTFSDEQRPIFVDGLSKVLRTTGRLFLLCFSEIEPGTDGPRRVSQAEIRNAFSDGWVVEIIEKARFAVRERGTYYQFSPGGPHAWLASIQRAGKTDV